MGRNSSLTKPLFHPQYDWQRVERLLLTHFWKPTREQVAEAYGATVPDLIKPNLNILFSGINPSLYSAAVGHHFARPGNRFWPTLKAARVTPRLFSPFEGALLLELGCGITNVVDRATATADELSIAELVAWGKALVEKVSRFRPSIVAFLGITAYRSGFSRPRATVGLQPDRICETRLWVLPNPSGLNAHYQLTDLGRLFAELWTASQVLMASPP